MTASPDLPPGDDPRHDLWTGRQVTDQVLSIVGLVCAVVSVLFSPVLFGLAGIVLGIVGHTKGESLGKWAAVAAGIGMIIGTVLSAVLESIM
ncbi:hypothetical protein [Nonomuraea turkmeniaca]|uniref:hypothetical protein n=1 Tax=Nonomuraea turkmeniaca TaxID=103838 RepID=UPI001B87D3EF|nr:hypothetical protein [Nonomuraea turkmeniaca]